MKRKLLQHDGDSARAHTQQQQQQQQQQRSDGGHKGKAMIYCMDVVPMYVRDCIL